MVVYERVGSDTGLVSCDWYSVSAKLAHVRNGEPIILPLPFLSVRLAATAVWAERWVIFDGLGDKVLTFLCSPRTPKIPALSCQVQVANRYLYNGLFHDVLDMFSFAVPMSFSGIARVDFCCDFEMDAAKYSVLSRLASRKAYVKALKSGNIWWRSINDAVRYDGKRLGTVPHDLNWGSPQSVFKWKIYWKALELEQALPEDKKPYISAMWGDAGFHKECVWRIEVSVTDTNRLVGPEGKKVLPVQWYDQRVALFQSIYASKFEVRLDQGHADKRNDKVLPFLDIHASKIISFLHKDGGYEDSDPERRAVCKFWHELRQPEVQANKPLADIYRSNLASLLEKPSNLWVLKHYYEVTEDDVYSAIYPSTA